MKETFSSEPQLNHEKGSRIRMSEALRLAQRLNSVIIKHEDRCYRVDPAEVGFPTEDYPAEVHVTEVEKGENSNQWAPTRQAVLQQQNNINEVVNIVGWSMQNDSNSTMQVDQPLTTIPQDTEVEIVEIINN